MSSLGTCVIANTPADMGEAMINRRIEGKSWKEIADEFNLGSPGAARAKFTKLTGITDYKIKGVDLKKLLDNDLLDTIKGAAKKQAAKVVSQVDDALMDAAEKKKWFVNHQLDDVDEWWKKYTSFELSNPTVNKYDIWADFYHNNVTSYLKLSQKYGVSISEVDEVIFRRLVYENDGNIWKAYKLKPTSEVGFKSVQQQVFDLRAKGWTIDEIESIAGIPKNVTQMILDGKWSLPAPGSASYVGAPPLKKTTIPTYNQPVKTYSDPVTIFEGPVSAGQNFTLTTQAEMNEWMAQFGLDLSPDQLAALKKYTGSGYTSINNGLRGIPGYPAPSQSLVDALDSSMKLLPRDLTVVRNCGYDAIGTIADIRACGGQVLKDAGYLSTSIDGGAFSGKPMQIIIDCPAGTLGRWVSNGVSAVGNGEKEILLARNTSMIVTKVEESTKNGHPFFKVWTRVIAQ